MSLAYMLGSKAIKRTKDAFVNLLAGHGVAE
jgi:hypothetical protein